MVEHQFVQAFEAVEGAAVFAQGVGGAVEEGGIKRGEQRHQIAHRREYKGVDDCVAAGLTVGFKRPIAQPGADKQQKGDIRGIQERIAAVAEQAGYADKR